MTAPAVAAATTEEFAAFYERFHSDSTYQLEHIAWPLDGNLRTDSAGNAFDARWSPEEWVLHRPLELGDAYVREIENAAPDLVIERVKTTAGQYIIERRFARFGDQWTLIYYRQAEFG